MRLVASMNNDCEWTGDYTEFAKTNQFTHTQAHNERIAHKRFHDANANWHKKCEWVRAGATRHPGSANIFDLSCSARTQRCVDFHRFISSCTWPSCFFLHKFSLLTRWTVEHTTHTHTHTKQQWPIAKHTPRLHSKSMQNSPLVPVGISTIRATAAYGILMWVICMIGWRHFSCSERSQVSVGDEQGQKLAWPPGLPCNKYAIFFGMFLRDGTHIEYVHNDRKQCVQIDMQSACSGGEKI